MASLNPTFTMFQTDDPNQTQTQLQQLDFNSDIFSQWRELLDLVSGPNFPQSLVSRIRSGEEQNPNWLALMPTNNAISKALNTQVLNFLKNTENRATLANLVNFHFLRNNSSLASEIDDVIFRAGGEPAVADNLPGYFPQEVQCSESQAVAGNCQIPVLPINTVLIPDSIQPQLQALYSVGESTVAKKNKKSIVIPQWLKKSAGSNNFS